VSWTDLINGTFELLAGGFFYLSVRRIQRDKKVQGVHWATLAFSSVWGLWNLPFYWALEQWLSLLGAVILAVVNTWYLVLVLKFADPEDRPKFKWRKTTGPLP